MSERRAKCDGNHGGPRCADPSCWNDDAPDRLSPETLVALREKAEKATPGPWRMAGTADRPHPVVSSFDRERGYQLHSMAHVQKSEPDVWPHMKAQYCADAAYIAAASPDVVLALVAEVLAARELFAAAPAPTGARE